MSYDYDRFEEIDWRETKQQLIACICNNTNRINLI